jgi:hypothetical protein
MSYQDQLNVCSAPNCGNVIPTFTEYCKEHTESKDFKDKLREIKIQRRGVDHIELYLNDKEVEAICQLIKSSLPDGKFSFTATGRTWEDGYTMAIRDVLSNLGLEDKDE